MYGLERRTAIERARGLLDLFELEVDRKIIAEYSKGMRKRVAMAASLIHHPELFLMDEPFEGVDAVGARLMKDILQDQVRRGATIFLTTHVLEVVERLCDRVAIINDGTIVTSGTLEELRAGGESLEDAFVRIVGAGRSLRVVWTGCDRGDPARAMAEHALQRARPRDHHPGRSRASGTACGLWTLWAAAIGIAEAQSDRDLRLYLPLGLAGDVRCTGN